MKKLMNKNVTPTKTSILNLISVFLLQGISFFTAPIFLRLLGAEQYGMFSLYASWSSVFSCFIGCSVGSALSTGKYQFGENYYQFRSSTLALGSTIAVVIIVICATFIKPLSKIMGFSVGIVLILLFSSAATFVTSFAQASFIYEKKPTINFVFSLVVTLCNVGLSLLFIFIGTNDTRYIARIYGTALPHIFAAVILWCLIFFKAPCYIKKEYAKFALLIGLPTVFHLLAQTVLVQSDRIMMQHMHVADADIGVYSAFYSLTAILSTILTALNNSWTPFYFDDLNEKAYDVLSNKCKNYYELFVVLTCGFLLLIREVASVYAGEGYFYGINVLPILTVVVFFTFLYQFPVNFEFFHKKTYYIASGTISAAICNIVLNFFMIHAWGMYGAAIATALSYFLLFVAHYILVRFVMKKERFHLKLKFFFPGIIAVALAMIAFYCLADLWYIRWCIGVLLGAMELLRILKRKSIF